MNNLNLRLLLIFLFSFSIVDGYADTYTSLERQQSYIAEKISDRIFANKENEENCEEKYNEYIIDLNDDDFIKYRYANGDTEANAAMLYRGEYDCNSSIPETAAPNEYFYYKSCQLLTDINTNFDDLNYYVFFGTIYLDYQDIYEDAVTILNTDEGVINNSFELRPEDFQKSYKKRAACIIDEIYNEVLNPSMGVFERNLVLQFAVNVVVIAPDGETYDVENDEGTEEIIVTQNVQLSSKRYFGIKEAIVQVPEDGDDEGDDRFWKWFSIKSAIDAAYEYRYTDDSQGYLNEWLYECLKGVYANFDSDQISACTFDNNDGFIHNDVTCPNGSGFAATLYDLEAQTSVAREQEAIDNVNAMAFAEKVQDAVNHYQSSQIDLGGYAFEGEMQAYLKKILPDKLKTLNSYPETFVNFHVIFQEVDYYIPSETNERNSFAEQVFGLIEYPLGYTGQKNVLITIPFYTEKGTEQCPFTVANSQGIAYTGTSTTDAQRTHFMPGIYCSQDVEYLLPENFNNTGDPIRTQSASSLVEVDVINSLGSSANIADYLKRVFRNLYKPHTAYKCKVNPTGSFSIDYDASSIKRGEDMIEDLRIWKQKDYFDAIQAKYHEKYLNATKYKVIASASQTVTLNGNVPLNISEQEQHIIKDTQLESEIEELLYAAYAPENITPDKWEEWDFDHGYKLKESKVKDKHSVYLKDHVFFHNLAPVEHHPLGQPTETGSIGKSIQAYCDIWFDNLNIANDEEISDGDVYDFDASLMYYAVIDGVSAIPVLGVAADIVGTVYAYEQGHYFMMSMYAGSATFRIITGELGGVLSTIDKTADVIKQELVNNGVANATSAIFTFCRKGEELTAVVVKFSGASTFVIPDPQILAILTSAGLSNQLLGTATEILNRMAADGRLKRIIGNKNFIKFFSEYFESNPDDFVRYLVLYGGYNDELKPLVNQIEGLDDYLKNPRFFGSLDKFNDNPADLTEAFEFFKKIEPNGNNNFQIVGSPVIRQNIGLLEKTSDLIKRLDNTDSSEKAVWLRNYLTENMPTELSDIKDYLKQLIDNSSSKAKLIEEIHNPATAQKLSDAFGNVSSRTRMYNELRVAYPKAANAVKQAGKIRGEMIKYFRGNPDKAFDFLKDCTRTDADIPALNKTPFERVLDIVPGATPPVTAQYLSQLTETGWIAIMKGYEAHHIIPISLLEEPAFKFLSKHGDFADGIFSNWINGVTKNATDNPANAIFVGRKEHGSHGSHTNDLKLYFDGWLKLKIENELGGSFENATAAIAQLENASNASQIPDIVSAFKDHTELVMSTLRTEIKSASIVDDTSLNNFNLTSILDEL